MQPEKKLYAAARVNCPFLEARKAGAGWASRWI